MKVRHCPCCDQDKPLDAFLASQPYCKTCVRAYKRERYRTDPRTRQKAIEAATRRAREKAVEVKAYQDAYRAKNRGRLNEHARRYRVEQADVIRERDRVRSKTNHFKALARARWHRRMQDPEFAAHTRREAKRHKRNWYVRHRASILTLAAATYHANPEEARQKIRVSVARWRERHPEKARAIIARRRALRRGAEAAAFDDEAHYARLLIWQQGRCYHCDTPLGTVRHRDHLVPIQGRRGVRGRHDAANLVLACAPCNHSKHAKLLWREWVPPVGGESAPLLLMETPVPVISTFAASERHRTDAAGILPALRQAYPGVPLIFDWEWFNRRSAVENVLAARDGTAGVTAARTTQVAEIDSATARDFFETHHLQGFGRGTVYTGLRTRDGELVAASAWLALEGAVELNRLAFRGRVVGGFGKLLANARRTFAAGVPVTSFVDQRYADGRSYRKLGFQDAGMTAAPTYYYVGPSGLFHRRLFTREAVQRRLTVFFQELSEHENARINGFYRVFGLPQLRFILPPGD